MNAASGSETVAEQKALTQYADWYASQGYSVSLRPGPKQLPDFLRALAPDMIARRDGENVVVQIKTSSPESFETVRELARALDHRAGWQLRVIYVDLGDPEWEPPAKLPAPAELAGRLETLDFSGGGDEQRRVAVLLLWSIIEAAGRYRLAPLQLEPTRRISSSALIKALLSEGLIEETQYELVRRGLAVRNAIAHGFLNQPVDAPLFEALRGIARDLLAGCAELVS
jgi:REase_AHJR-like protein